jgi:putative redox protein
MDRTAYEHGCLAMTFSFRDAVKREGDFSMVWVDDLRNAISHVLSMHEPTSIILLGANTGGSIAICVEADNPRASAAGLLSSSITPVTSGRSRVVISAVGGGVAPRVPPGRVGP